MSGRLGGTGGGAGAFDSEIGGKIKIHDEEDGTLDFGKTEWYSDLELAWPNCACCGRSAERFFFCNEVSKG